HLEEGAAPEPGGLRIIIVPEVRWRPGLPFRAIISSPPSSTTYLLFPFALSVRAMTSADPSPLSTNTSNGVAVFEFEATLAEPASKGELTTRALGNSACRSVKGWAAI